MPTLLLGATGLIGPRVIEALKTHGVEIVAASRSGAGAYGIALDRRDVEAVKAVVRERNVDTVIDLLAYTQDDTVPLLDALDGEVERWVMASSGDVYRNFAGLIRKAQPMPLNEPLSEDSPLRTVQHPMRQDQPRDPSAPDAFMDKYDKIPLEAHLRARTGLSSVIMRLPMVYGPCDAQRRFQWIVQPMLSGANELIVDPGWADWRSSYGFVDNVADALAVASLHPNAPGHTFNIAEDTVSSHRDWIAQFSRALDWGGEVIIRQEAERSGPAAALDLRYWLLMDGGVFRKTCGWKAPIELDIALARTIDDERKRSVPATL